MIEMVTNKQKNFGTPDPVMAELSRPQPARQEAAPAVTGAAPQTNEQQQRVAPANGGFEVHLDADTMRLYSELRDPATDRVILRLPEGYQPSAKAEANHKPTSLVA